MEEQKLWRWRVKSWSGNKSLSYSRGNVNHSQLNFRRSFENIFNGLVTSAEQVFGACVICPKETKLTKQPRATCFNMTTQKCFSIAWSLEMENESLVIIQNARDNGYRWKNRREVLPSSVYTPKRRFCVLDGVSRNCSFWNAAKRRNCEYRFLLRTIWSSNDFLIEKCAGIVTTEGVIPQHGITSCAVRKTNPGKLTGCGGRYRITLRTLPTLHRRIFVYSVRRDTFHVAKSWKSKMTSPGILLGIRLSFIDAVLKTRALDGKMFLMTTATWSLTKNENKFKFSLLDLMWKTPLLSGSAVLIETISRSVD